MPDNEEIIAGVGITITGDFSDLDSQFAAATAEAQQQGEALAAAIQDSLQVPDTSGIKDAYSGISDAAEGAGQAIAKALDVPIQAPDTSAITTAFQDVASAATAAQEPLTGLQQLILELVSSGEAANAVEGLALAIQAVGPAADTSGLTEWAAAIDQAGTNSATAGQDIGGLGSAAETAADQMSLFGDSVKIPFADVDGQLNLFASDIEVMAGDATSAAGAADDLGTALQGAGAEAGAAGGLLSSYGEAAQGIVQAQQQADQELATAQSALAEIQAAYDLGAASANDLARAAEAVQSAFSAANPAIQQTADDTKAAVSAAEAATTAFGALNTVLGALGISLSLVAFVNFAEDVGQAADSITRADISLTALTGDAQTAGDMIGKLEQIGLSDGLSMPGLLQAAQSMTNMLPVGTDVVGILGQIADAAAFSGKSIETAASAFDRIAESGSASAKTLNTLGLSMESLGQAMTDAGVSASDMANGVTKAFKALDVHDRIVVLQTDLTNLQGIAEDVANNTFGGAWHQALAQFDIDIDLVQKGLGNLATQALGATLKDSVNTAAAAFVAAGTLIVAAIDSIEGSVNAASISISAFGKSASEALSGNWAAAAATLADGFTKVQTAEAATQAKIQSDLQAGQKIMTDILTQIPTSVAPAIDSLDGLGTHAKDASDKAGAAFAAAEKSVISFDNVANSGSDSVEQLQRAFENTSKAITTVAKQDLPLAIQAVDDYNQAQLNNNAGASVLISGFTEESKLIQQLGKSDLPAAIEAMSTLAQKYLDANAPVGIINAAFSDQEKLISTLAKTDVPGAIAAQAALAQQYVDSEGPINLITDAFTKEQSLIQSLAKNELPAAMAAQAALTQAEIAANQPAQDITASFQAQQKLIQQLATTDLPGAIAATANLAQAEISANQPAQTITATFGAQQKLIQTLATTDLPAAITAMGSLAQAEIAANQPAQTVTQTFQDQQALFQKLAQTDLQAAADGIGKLAQAEIAANQPTQIVTAAFQAQQAVFDKMAAAGDFKDAIAGLTQLAQTEANFAPTGTAFVKTLQDEQTVFDQLAKTNLQGAIDGLKGLVDQEVALNAPAATITATLDDERSKIQALGGTNVTAAIALLQQLIDKQIALKQPTDDINASLKLQSDLLQKQVNTDLPAAISAYQNYLDKLNQQSDIYKAINAAGAQTVQQQQFQISSEQQLLASANSTNLAYGDRLKIEATLAQNEINLATAQGQYAGDYVLGLEKINLQQQILANNAQGFATAEVNAIKDINKGFDQLGSTIADAIVNGKNLGDALVAQFKKVATSVLGDLIQGALTPLKSSLMDLESSILPSLGSAFKVSGASADTLNAAMKTETDTVNSVVNADEGLGKSASQLGSDLGDVSSSAKSTGSSLGGFASSLTSWMSAIGAIIGAIAGIIGDVYLAAIDTKLFTVETDLNKIFQETTNARTDAWSQFNSMYDRLGEIKNDADTMLVTLQAMYAGGSGGSFPAAAANDLDNISTASDKIVTELGIIDGSTHLNISATLSVLQAVNAGFADVHDTLYMLNSSVEAVTAAILYGNQQTGQMGDRMQADSQMVTDSISASGAAVGHAITGGVSDVNAAANGRAVSVINSAANNAVTVANAQYAAAQTVADQLSALEQEYATYQQLAIEAQQAGDLDLANKYHADAAALLLQINSINEGITIQNGTMANVYTATVEGNSGDMIATTNAGTLVSTAVNNAAVTISGAVMTASVASAAYMATSLSTLIQLLGSGQNAVGPRGPVSPGGEVSPGVANSGGATGTQNTGPYNPNGPGVTPPYTGPTTSGSPGYGEGYISVGGTSSGTRGYATGGYIEEDQTANLHAGEIVVPSTLVQAMASGLNLANNQIAVLQTAVGDYQQQMLVLQQAAVLAQQQQVLAQQAVRDDQQRSTELQRSIEIAQEQLVLAQDQGPQQAAIAQAQLEALEQQQFIAQEKLISDKKAQQDAAERAADVASQQALLLQQQAQQENDANVALLNRQQQTTDQVVAALSTLQDATVQAVSAPTASSGPRADLPTSQQTASLTDAITSAASAISDVTSGAFFTAIADPNASTGGPRPDLPQDGSQQQSAAVGTAVGAAAPPVTGTTQTTPASPSTDATVAAQAQEIAALQQQILALTTAKNIADNALAAAQATGNAANIAVKQAADDQAAVQLQTAQAQLDAINGAATQTTTATAAATAATVAASTTDIQTQTTTLTAALTAQTAALVQAIANSALTEVNSIQGLQSAIQIAFQNETAILAGQIQQLTGTFNAVGQTISGLAPQVLPSYDTGGYVPGDMVAQLHGGEFVIPQDVTGMLRSMASAPSSQYSLPGAVGAAVGTGQAPMVFNVYGPNTQDIVRQIAAYMKRQGVGASYGN